MEYNKIMDINRGGDEKEKEKKNKKKRKRRTIPLKTTSTNESITGTIP